MAEKAPIDLVDAIDAANAARVGVPRPRVAVAVTGRALETWPKAARLRRRSEFLAVQGVGRRWSGAHFSAWFRARDVEPGGSSVARIGVTVSRRVGGSVVRNRVKRWLREAFRRVRVKMPAVEVVCVARPTAATAGWVALAADVSRFANWVSSNGGVSSNGAAAAALPVAPSVTR